MLDDPALLDSPATSRFYDPDAPLDKALPEAIAEHGLRRLPDKVVGSSKPESLVPGLLRSLGLEPADYAVARASARRNGTDTGRELVAEKRVTDDAIARAMASALGVSDAPLLCDDRIVGDKVDARASAKRLHKRLLRTCDPGLNTRIVMAPRIEDLDETRRILAAHQDRLWQASVASPRTIARHRAEASATARAEAARLSLSGDRPELSARHVLTGLQGMVVAAILIAVAIVAIVLPDVFLATLHFLALPLFLGCVLMRVAAAAMLSARPAPPVEEARWNVDKTIASGPCPTYSVLVALHREKDMARELVAALAALEWPRSRLEVMLVCEGDDTETIAAVEAAIATEPGFEIVIVPPSLPRTKPKALNFALPLATGEFIVLYDAEDRPRPDQLHVALARFRSGDERLACLQAPLIVRNGAGNWLAGHFALEYAALFRGFLPWLARVGLPLPLV